MSTRSLPPRPNLAQLKIQANELHKAHRDGQLSAAARIVAHHPRFKRQALQAVLDKLLALADAQLVIAREYGFDNWAQLKQRVELGSRIDEIEPHPRFDAALAALDAGDLAGLRSLIASDPPLVHARANLDPPYGYFTGATLLHHVAGNPDRGRFEGRLPPMPNNSADIARLLLDAGADVNALTLGPAPSTSPITSGATTMGLIVTSKQANDANVTGTLMDVLLEYGATLDLQSDDALDASLANHAPRAAEKMIALGAKPDILAAAALGRMDLLRGFFASEGKLASRPRRHGQAMSDRDAIGLAMLYAYVREQREAVDFLLAKDGNWNMVGVNNGTALHRAAWSGDLVMVQRLVAKGADINNRDNPFGGTPMGWAGHNEQTEVVQWIQAHCAVDMLDAVVFDLHDHVEARLRADPASASRRVDAGEIPQGTPLHAAARLNRVELAKLLYENGAGRDTLAGNGMTPLDVADAHGAAAVVALLEERGARRAADTLGRAQIRARPPYRIDERYNKLEARALLDTKDWDAIITVMAEKKIAALDANGQMTDAAIERVARLDHVTGLELAGSQQLTDAGLRHLARLPRLLHVDLSGCGITDRGLKILRELPELRTFRLHHDGISDAGAGHLAHCHRLERVTLMSTRFTDAALGALTGKPSLHNVRACGPFTEASLALFHEFPVFKTWQGAEMRYGLMDFDAEPNSLSIVPVTPFSNGSLTPLVGLDGLFALNLDNPTWKEVNLEPLAALQNLGWLGHDATDESMRHIGTMPRLRFLMCQDTTAGDEGFVALGRSQTIEYIWGRRCYNLTGRGFTALSTMPALRGLAVSCKNVNDAALSTLPRFPALREFMPMDVPDAGFRHVGRCEHLEALWCMYCRDTTDAATAHIARLRNLKTYYAGQTKITDRSLEMLARMPSLEKLEFWNCPGITNAGAAALASLPRLRDVTFDLCRRITPDAAAVFPTHVRVRTL